MKKKNPSAIVIKFALKLLHFGRKKVMSKKPLSLVRNVHTNAHTKYYKLNVLFAAYSKVNKMQQTTIYIDMHIYDLHQLVHRCTSAKRYVFP